MITEKELAILHKHGTSDVRALVDESRRLRDTLRKVRPSGHDHLCGADLSGNDADVWLEVDPYSPESGLGWCCHLSTVRHAIDLALGDVTPRDPRTTEGK